MPSGAPLVEMPDLQKVFDFLNSAFTCTDLRFEAQMSPQSYSRFRVKMEVLEDPRSQVAAVRAKLLGDDGFVLPIGDTPWVLSIQTKGYTHDVIESTGLGGFSHRVRRLGPIRVTIEGELLLKRNT